MRCYVIEVNQSKRQLVLSRKAVLEEEAAKRRSKIVAELRSGEVRIGRIVRVSAEGLLIDIGGVEGLVRPADVSWGAAPAAKPPQRGEKLRVKVLSKPVADASEDYFAATGERRIARQDQADGVVSTVVGNGEPDRLADNILPLLGFLKHLKIRGGHGTDGAEGFIEGQREAGEPGGLLLMFTMTLERRSRRASGRS